jgi:membrane protease YdiL (CAAX protease family)
LLIVPVCKTCGKKYSRWTTPVSARGECRKCFEAGLLQERQLQPKPNVAPGSLDPAPRTEANAQSAKDDVHPPVSLDVLLETAGVTLAFFGSRILLNWLGFESKSVVTTHGLVANSLSDLGWILLVVCLLNRSGSFQWRLPGSTKLWLSEFGWGAVLFVINGLAKVIVIRIGLALHLPSKPTFWTEALRNHSTWIAFQLSAPLSAMYQELVCRVYMQSRLTQIFRGDSVFVVLVCSLLFTGIHNYAPLQSLGVFVAGIVYGVSYQLNGKIPRLVIAHAAHNLIGGFALNTN